MFEEISFPEHEYESIQNYLNKLGYCYTTRVYKEIGKYKVGELYAGIYIILQILCSRNTFPKREFYNGLSLSVNWQYDV